MLIHTVKPNETYADIAATYGLPTEILLRENGISMSDTPVAGQELLILYPVKTVTVKPGDTLYHIAAQNNTTVNQLFRLNPGLFGNPLIYPGQSLVLSYAGYTNQSIIVNGYAYPFISIPDLAMVLPFLTYLTIFTYGFQPNGDLIIPSVDDKPIIDYAKRFDVPSVLLLSTLSFDGTFNNMLAEKLLLSDEAQDNLIDQLIARCSALGYSGVEVDFEYLSSRYRKDFVSFLNRLFERLHNEGLLLFTALAPKTSDSQPGLQYEGIDYEAIGKVSDYVILMCYEWGYAFGSPEAVAPIDKVEKVVRYAVSVISPEKILLGVPNYGYDWRLPYQPGITEAKSIGNAEAIAIARAAGVSISYDRTAAAPYFTYTDENGNAHEVWFENATGLSEKLNLVDRYNLSGISVWNLMRPINPLDGIIADRYDVEN